jgi:hypothetical protein
MNKSLKYGLLIFLTVSSAQLNAQVKSGYVFGINLSTMTIKANGISYPAERPVNVHFGRYFEVPFNKYLFLHSSLLFSAKGTDYSIDTTDISIAPIYFEVPVNAVGRFGTRSVKMSLSAGPYFACGIGGYKIVTGSELKQLRYGSEDYSDLKRFDIGYNLGAGINIKGFMISVQYQIGLSNISPLKTYDSEIKNQVIGVTISAGGWISK